MRVLVERGGCPPGGWEAGKRVSLDQQEIQHLKVRRARDGERVEVLDGAGLQAAGTLVRIGRGWAVDVTASQRTQRPPALTLAVAAGDRERFSWMVEKAVELGVTRVVPLETARTAGVATGLKRAHIGRLQRSALESIKQCGVVWAPEIEDILPLPEFLGQPLAGTGWLADQGGDAAPSSMAEETPLSVVIGPEGGLTDEEREAAMRVGYRPLALGRYTLRFETAALAAAVTLNQARMRGHHG